VVKLSGPEHTKRRARELRAEMSLPERLLWSALRRQQTGLRFRRQHPAGPYILDFYCDSIKLCVEVDDLSHDFRATHDAARDRWLLSQGVRTLRVSARDVLRNLEGVVQSIGVEARTPSDALRASASPEGE
jgi:very-short-patch-repair endonuclease